ncbi:DUF5624 domain-containing protein [Actinospica sp.]|jgi:hypothetical protein|uniref:DUF5624 domain-containing protein n=1 Tax=Actinospica sp. TaxID=1872142 RepID=UPI002BB9A543|nr:DUF5624 domain-containing protein [Actinospica sp.]HWG28645.1 DUF5624 domain-containing protein [Actinospica sp.]
MTAVYESPEFVRLFNTYTADPDSIGRRLGRAYAAAARDTPLLVATGADFALYPGSGKAPQVVGYRLSPRGFKELTAVSHLGPAVASLVYLRTALGDASWRPDAERLLAEVKNSRAANSAQLWRERIAVEAYQGREQQIAAMVDYTCAVTARYLTAALDDEDYLNPETLRADFLEGGGAPLPVPVNHVMVATFFLAGLDISFRIGRWLRAQEIDWERAMVLIAGRQGRPTAGVTWTSSSVATLILGASAHRLPLERMYLAPHAPTFASPRDGDLSEVVALEGQLRGVWCATRVTVELGGRMFEGYPRYAPASVSFPDVHDPAVTEISEMPAVRTRDDMRSLVTRLRMVMEDPRQLLSGAVTDLAVEALGQADWDPADVYVPGLTDVHYPTDL